jgi:DUF1009 family protein
VSEGRRPGGALADRSPLGILAAGGDLPVDIAKAARAAGRPVHIIALAGIAGDAVSAFPHDWSSLGQLGRIIGCLHRAGCRDLVIAGAMQRPDLLKLRIDLGFIRHLPTVVRLTQGGDDSVLRKVVRFFEGQGFTVVGLADVAPHLLAPEGVLGAISVSAAGEAAIRRGERLMGRLGAFDIGQAIVATADRIVAVEGGTGTDAMLRELGPGSPGDGLGRGGVLLKLAKPSQELRVDLPTIGPVTIERAAAAGLAGIAVSAGAATIMDRAATVRAADAAGIALVGVPGHSGERPASVTRAPHHGGDAPALPQPLAVLSKRAPTPGERADLALARELLAVLAAEGAGRAAVIANLHVLAVEADLALARVLAPLGGRRHWGLRAVRGRIGILALDRRQEPAGAEGATRLPPVPLDPALFTAVRDARLAGVACFGAEIPAGERGEIVAWANEAQVFLMGEPGAEA